MATITSLSGALNTMQEPVDEPGADYEKMEPCSRCRNWHMPPHPHLDWRPPFADQSVPLESIPVDAPPALLLGRLAPDGPTILFGMGGIGKGVLSASWVARLASEGRRVLIVDYEGNPREWGRRITALDTMHAAPGNVRYLQGRTTLRKDADVVKEHVAHHKIDYMVVDSAVMACGADPMKPEAAMDYAAALVAIECPSLTLAHITKSRDDNTAYPFGSIFWHNTARVTWSLARDGAGLVLAHRKHNNYEQQPRSSVEITWRDDLPREVWEKSYRESLADRIADALGDGGMTVAQLVETLTTDDGAPSRHSVIAALKRDRLRFACTHEGKGQRWECVQ